MRSRKNGWPAASSGVSEIASNVDLKIWNEALAGGLPASLAAVDRFSSNPPVQDLDVARVLPTRLPCGDLTTCSTSSRCK